MAFPSYPGDVRQKLSFQNCRQNRYLHAHLCSSLKVSYSSWKWHTRTVILNQEQGSKSSCYLLVIIGKGTFPKGLKNYYESSLSPAMGIWSVHCRIKKKKRGGWGGGLSLSSLLVYQYFEQTVDVLFPYVVAVCKGEITGLNQLRFCWLVGWVGLCQSYQPSISGGHISSEYF